MCCIALLLRQKIIKTTCTATKTTLKYMIEMQYALLFVCVLAFATLGTVSAYQDDGTRTFRPWPPLNDPAHTLGSTALLLDPCSFTFSNPSAAPSLDAAVKLYHDVIFPGGCSRSRSSSSSRNKKAAAAAAGSSDTAAAPSALGKLTALQITCPQPAEWPPVTATNESYTLTVPVAGGRATLQGASYVGVLRGLETFSQLVQYGRPSGASVDSDYVFFIGNAPVVIGETPAFPHRGLLIDPARTFLPLADIERVIDGMMYSKMNVLHLHLTDSQSFPLELSSYPEVTQHGALDASKVYTAAAMSNLVHYAAERGVQLVPEIDSPGHARAIGLSPNLTDIVACANTVDWSKHCAEPPCGQLNPASTQMYTVMQAVLNEVAALFPSTHLHVGYDEINFACWEDEPSIAAYLKAHNLTVNELLLEFYTKQRAILDIVASAKTAVTFWEEAALQVPPLPLRASDVVQVWSSQENLDKVLNSTPARVVVSWYENVYMDCGLGNMFGKASWCDPYKTFLHMYSTDPLNGFPQDQLHRVLGGEAAMWGEETSPASIHTRVWPRAAAYGGRLWAHANPVSDEIALLSVAAHADRLAARGISTSSVALPYCQRFPSRCFAAAGGLQGAREASRRVRERGN
eukprot:UC1_evm1s1733